MTPFLVLFIVINGATTVFAQIRQDWIDPHEITVTDTSILSSSNKEKCPEPTCPNKVDNAIVHYKRVINLLLNSIMIDRSDPFSYNGRLYIKMNLETYDYLRDFARNSEEDTATLRKIDGILTNILTKPTHEHIVEALIDWTDYFYNRTTGILLAGAFTLLLSYKLLRANLTIWSVVKYLIFLGWIIDFSFTWINLLQEAEINNMADYLKYKSLPPQCDPNQLSFWKYTWYLIAGENSECREYHHIIHKNHFWSIAPLTVLSHQSGIMILTPATYIGKAVGSFSSALLGNLPPVVNIILFPLLIIFTTILICIALSFLTNTSFGFNILHFIQFHFGNNDRRVIGDALSGENLRNFLGIVHRNAIQDVNINEREVQNVEESRRNNSNGAEIAGPTCRSCQSIRDVKNEGENGSHNLAIKDAECPLNANGVSVKKSDLDEKGDNNEGFESSTGLEINETNISARGKLQEVKVSGETQEVIISGEVPKVEDIGNYDIKNEDRLRKRFVTNAPSDGSGDRP